MFPVQHRGHRKVWCAKRHLAGHKTNCSLSPLWWTWLRSRSIMRNDIELTFLNTI
ncbi:UNVERIFIED_CONTAM: hypothetical protein GTU68_000404 [Idotea baltica]|nr:hypothetical protein [Idotea baltica]